MARDRQNKAQSLFRHLTKSLRAPAPYAPIYQKPQATELPSAALPGCVTVVAQLPHSLMKWNQNPSLLVVMGNREAVHTYTVTETSWEVL